MDTRATVFTLIDYNDFYSEGKKLGDALNLIRNIPSETLLNYLSGFDVNLYLRENFKHAGLVQAYILDSILKKLPPTKERWKEILQSSKDEGQSPVIIWNFTNLLFYGLLFKRFNRLKGRDLSKGEALVFFKAYLIVNSIANSKINIEEEELIEASLNNNIEEITVPNFIYQKDYISTTDFSNQVVRGVMLFRFLEADFRYRDIIKEFYLAKHVTGHLRMFKNLLVLFSELKIEENVEERSQLINLKEYVENKEIDLDYIETLCVNNHIKSYVEDNSFSQLRKTFLYKSNRHFYFVLNVNFLIDAFYKAQVFEFNSFLKSRAIKGDFLSIKAKDFMEEIYLPHIFKNCFPNQITYFGSQCKNSINEELCDVYIRDGNKICLIEFKDVTLNAEVKNSRNRDILFPELDKKFIANQKKKPKGITQLLNAIYDIEKHGVLFDKECPNDLQVFPIIIYTDFSFGLDGINKGFREKIKDKLLLFSSSNIKVDELTFINLNFFELHEEYFSKKYLNIFDILQMYHIHIQKPDYGLTPFEVFSRFYMDEYIKFSLDLPVTYKKIINEIKKS